MKLHKVAFVLLAIGGVDLLLEGFGTGISHWVSAGVTQVIYIIIGLAALIEIFGHKKNCRNCNSSGTTQ